MSTVRRELDKVTPPLEELRRLRVQLANQTARMKEQAATLKAHRTGGYGAHGVFGLPRKKVA